MDEEKRQKRLIYLVYICIGEIILFFARVYIEIEYWKWTAQLPDNVHISSELINTWNSINEEKIDPELTLF